MSKLFQIQLSLFSLLIVGTILFFSGFKTAAWIVCYGGTLLVLFMWLIYVAFWHSRSRWPDQNGFQRLVNILTFRRD